MAFRATPYRIGKFRKPCLPQNPRCCILCRNLSVKNILSSNENRKLKDKHEHSNGKHLKEASTNYPTTGNVAAVGSDEQTVAQWAKIGGYFLELRESVGSLSLSWKSEADGSVKSNGKDKLSEETVSCKEKKEQIIDATNAVIDQAQEQSEKVKSLSKQNEIDETNLNAKWVEQLLEMEGKMDQDLEEPVKEKLDDHLAETNTQPVSKQKEQPKSLSFTDRMTFSYFSRANQPENTPVVNEKTVSDTSKTEVIQTDPVGTQASTIDWIRGAVGLSTSKKDSGNVLDLREESLKAVVEDSLAKDEINKINNETYVDKSYWNVLSNLQQSILVSLSLSNAAPKTPVESAEHVARNIMHSELESESGFGQRTRSLADNLVAAQSTMSKKKRIQDLCSHLTQHPQFRHIAVKHNVIPCLLEMQTSGNPNLMAMANEALALVGYIPPPQGRGIKMLSIDGGGTRGLIAIEILQNLERHFNQPVNQMFDFVIGSSTGALLASLIFILKLPLAECKELYLDKSRKVFVKESLLKKTRNMALHDVSVFEQVVKKEIGECTLIDTAKDPATPKMAITATLANIPKWKTFMFRNYNHQPGVISDYMGSCNIKIWEAIRASSSAPIYYSPFQIGNHIFRDGGLLVNNPTAAGIHECKLLWPHESLQCVLSLGNGKYDPNLDRQKAKGYTVIPRSMKDLADGVIDSATETEEVHMILKNTLTSGCYFRLSPYLKENYALSEVQPQKIDTMLKETEDYMAKNEQLIQQVVARLKQDRLPNQRIVDYASQRKLTHDYFVFKPGRFKSHGHNLH